MQVILGDGAGFSINLIWRRGGGVGVGDGGGKTLTCQHFYVPSEPVFARSIGPFTKSMVAVTRKQCKVIIIEMEILSTN